MIAVGGELYQGTAKALRVMEQVLHFKEQRKKVCK